MANPSTTEQITEDLLDAVTDAFNRRDLNTVMDHFADDAIFDHGAGPDVFGKRFSGKAAIRAVFKSLFDNVESISWTTLDARVNGNKAYCEYHRIARMKSGEVQDFHSIDVLTYRNSLIVHKDTYYKHRTN